MTPDFYRFNSGVGHHLLVVDGSRVYDLPSEMADNPEVDFKSIFPAGRTYVTSEPLSPPPLRSISLNVAQGCNMSCSYCYADEGRFGRKERLMSNAVARLAVDQLLAQVPPGSDAVIGFMGGEPFLNRAVLHDITKYAAKEASSRDVRLRFSVTTNATLLSDDDAALLAEYPFSVAVSLDGNQAENDRFRVLRTGKSAYEKARIGINRLLEAEQRPRHISVRATITPRSKALPEILDDLLSLGVDEAGFAPVMVSPNPFDEFEAKDFDRFLDQMIVCGKRCMESICAHRRYPFSNFETALQEISRGSHRPYSCGAAAGYASVSAEGNYSACHRTIDDPVFDIGSLKNGLNTRKRTQFLAERHVLQQNPCNQCWARFLCGGGCHHEVTARGRKGCDYIRGWLTFCLAAYAELSTNEPDYFQDPALYFQSVRRESHV